MGVMHHKGEVLLATSWPWVLEIGRLVEILAVLVRYQTLNEKEARVLTGIFTQ